MATIMDQGLDAATIESFKTSLRGVLLRPGDENYDAARQVWNGMIDKRPALIARCAGPGDVVQAVNFARTNNLPLSVRGGGHNITGNAVCDGGLMIDLSPMKGIRVDPDGRTARAQGGVTWAEFDHETQAFGLATTGGFVPSTGIAGVTLGGGFGYLMRRCGLACDNLLSVDIVTADGQPRTASAAEHADLFWGVRGGGGNFGVVTSLKYRLHPVGPLVLAGLILHPIAQAREATRFYHAFTRTAPDELTVVLAYLILPDGQPVVGFLPCYSGPLARGGRDHPAAARLRHAAGGYGSSDALHGDPGAGWSPVPARPPELLEVELPAGVERCGHRDHDRPVLRHALALVGGVS